MTTEYYPALRGRFGDWAYYSVLMTLGQIAEKVSYAADIHSSRNLSDMIQRELRGGRSRAIAEYLRTNEDRFFNSLVIAVYEGEPEWLPFEQIRPRHDTFEPEDLSDTAAYSLGYLRLNGDERLFALDGQHRLAGIKMVAPAGSEIAEEEVSVLFVAHHNDPEGMRRTRKLFTTLNKSAKAVNKSEIIALDEADVMAIIVRRLVEEHPWFRENRILFRGQANLPPDDVDHFTTIQNLYDVLTVLFTKVRSKEKLEKLKFYRPSDEVLQAYFEWTRDFFEKVAESFPPVGEYLRGSNDRDVIRRERTGEGGHLLFRPVGLLILAEVLARLAPEDGIDRAVELAARLPMELSQAPYSDVIWRSQTRRMDPAKRSTSRQLLLHMLGRLNQTELRNVRRRYADLLGVDPAEVELPAQILVR